MKRFVAGVLFRVGPGRSGRSRSWLGALFIGAYLLGLLVLLLAIGLIELPQWLLETSGRRVLLGTLLLIMAYAVLRGLMLGEGR